MSKNGVCRKVIKIKSKVHELDFLLNSIVEAVEYERLDMFNRCLSETVVSSEKIALLIRDFAYMNMPKDRDLFCKSIVSKCHKVDISIINEDIVKLSVPVLFTTNATSKRFILEPLQSAIEMFKTGNKIPTYDKFAILFRACVRKEQRDNDNYEYKQTANLLAVNFLSDDNSNDCSFVYQTKINDQDSQENRTEIYIIPVAKIADFL